MDKRNHKESQKSPMRVTTRITLACLAALLCSSGVHAQETGHYVPGLTGLKSASVPAPGFYYANLTLSYTFDRINDPDGKPTTLDADINVLGNVNSLIWILEPTILGARYGLQANIPITNRAYLPGDEALNQVGKTGVADIYIQPLNLGWSSTRNHFNVRYGFFAPTGRFQSGGLSNTGKGFWTHMFTVGDTIFLGPERTWHASAMFRYETHTKKEGVDLTAGDDIVLDWGVGKTLGTFDVGVVGANTWQVTREKGMDSVSTKYSAHALGGAVQYAIPRARLSLRFLANFDVRTRNRAEGILLAFMLVWKP